MQKLNFHPYPFRFKNDGRVSIFDEIRRRFIILTPEEWVRQHVVHFLIHEKGYPKSWINVEKMLSVNGLSKRYDVVVYRPDGTIFLLVECKAPHIAITQTVFDQIARYNLSLNASALMVTNGLDHYFCRMDYAAGRYEFLPSLPDHAKNETA